MIENMIEHFGLKSEGQLIDYYNNLNENTKEWFLLKLNDINTDLEFKSIFDKEIDQHRIYVFKKYMFENMAEYSVLIEDNLLIPKDFYTLLDMIEYMNSKI